MNDNSNIGNEIDNCSNCGLPHANAKFDSSFPTCACQNGDKDKQSSSIRICRMCNKRIIERDSASVTQWIFKLYGCKCDQKKLVDSNFARGPIGIDEEGKICTNCGKRIRDEEEGSITQWIFQSHLCSCGIPSPPTIEEPDLINQEQAIYKEVYNADDGQKSTFLPEQFRQLKEDVELEHFESELDRYSPLKLLGKGAVGSVYLCYDKFLQKPVAIKMLNHITDEQVVSFQREAKSASKLSHRFIIDVLDFGTTTSGKPYMVMEFIEGINLAEHLKKVDNLSVLDAILLIEKLCQALAYAHESGVLHHDIKSTNIILCDASGADKYPVLIDLGVAVLKQKEEDKESSTEIVGSASYLAPEYIAGGSYDERSEVYSVGCVLFELLTGDVPYLGDSLIETLKLHSNAEIPTLTSRRPDLEFSDEIENILNRCLSKSVDDRFQNVNDLQDQLNTIIENATEYETRAIQVEHMPVTSHRPAFSKKILYGSLVVLLVSIVGSLLYITNQSTKPKEKKVDLDILSRNSIALTTIPPFPKSVSEFGVNGYFLKHRILIVPDANSAGRLAEAINNRARIDRLELACIKLSPKEIRQIRKIEPKVLKLFGVSGIDKSVLEELAQIESIEALGIARSTLIDKNSLEGLAASKSIRSLTIQDCSLDNHCIFPLSKIKSLTELNINLNPLITRTGLVKLVSSNIKTLNVFGSVELRSAELKRTSRQLGMVVRSTGQDSVIANKPKMSSKFVLQPKSALLKDVGHFYKKRTDYGLSVEYYEACVRHCGNAGKIEAYQRIGVIYQENLDHASAIKNFSTAIDVYAKGDKNSVSENYYQIAKRMRANSYLEIGEKEKALKDINEVIKLAKKRQTVSEAMLRIKLVVLMAMNRNKEALSVANAVLKKFSDSETTHVLQKIRLDLLDRIGKTEQNQVEESKLEK